MKKQTVIFSEGPITGPLIRFTVPVFLAMLLQSLYGAVDLLIVGRFAGARDISAVSTGSQVMMMTTYMLSSFAMGLTVVLGQLIGEGNREKAGHVMGTGIVYFLWIGIAMSILMLLFARPLCTVLNSPPEAFSKTVAYVRICGGGMAVIIAYNLIGSIFRGIGDSKTPLIAVMIAAVFNIAGDLLLVAVFRLGAAGAAIATVAAQFLSVALSVLLIRKKQLPFDFNRSMLKLKKEHVRRITSLGLPIALQDLLVNISFLVILAIVNGLGLIVSAGVGVAEKVCGFIMLIPSAFSQTMAAASAQNIGAGKYARAKRSMWIALLMSGVPAVVMFFLSFFRGDLLAGIFSKDAAVVEAGAEYLKAYAVDCLFTCVMFNMVGFFNGLGMTRFTMLQGLAGAFCARIPVSYIMSKRTPVSLFAIGLATPCSTFLQIILCLFALRAADKRFEKKRERAEKLDRTAS